MKRQSTEVVKIMRGSTEVSKIYHGTSLYYDKNVHPDILLEYLGNGDSATVPSSTANVYFNTNITMDTSTSVEVKVSCDYVAANVGYLFGTRKDSAVRFCVAFYAGGTNTTAGTNQISTKVYYWNTNYGPYYDNGQQANTPYVITIKNDNNTFFTNLDSSVQSRTLSTPVAAASTGCKMYLFGYGNESGIDTSSLCKAGVKFYYIKIWSNGNLMRFYIPVLHYINNQYVPCFYDKVNDNYIYNLGTDTPEYRIKGDYVLDFIANSLTSANVTGNSNKLNYDTGVTLVTGLNYDTKFYVGGDNSSTGENYIFGTRSSSGNKYALFAPNANSSNLWFTVSKINASTNWSYGVPIKLSTYMNSSNIRCMYVDGSTYTGQQQENSSVDLFDGTYTMYIHGNAGNQRQGNRIYYFSIRNSSEVPLRNYVPVLHNGTPAYYDLNTNTYSYNSSDTGTPVYVIKNS